LSEKGVATAMANPHIGKNGAVTFGCKGPMGKGLFLDLNDLSGHYTAFAAGTGSLVFLDLVLRIFLQNYAKVYFR